MKIKVPLPGEKWVDQDYPNVNYYTISLSEGKVNLRIYVNGTMSDPSSVGRQYFMMISRYGKNG